MRRVNTDINTLHTRHACHAFTERWGIPPNKPVFLYCLFVWFGLVWFGLVLSWPVVPCLTINCTACFHACFPDDMICYTHCSSRPEPSLCTWYSVYKVTSSCGLKRPAVVCKVKSERCCTWIITTQVPCSSRVRERAGVQTAHGGVVMFTEEPSLKRAFTRVCTVLSCMYTHQRPGERACRGSSAGGAWSAR